MGRLVSRKRHCKHSAFERLARRAGYGAGQALTFVGTGNGALEIVAVLPESPDGEVWTITFSDATNFAVSGSSLGAQAAGVVGTEYTSDGDEITFLITAGGTPFVNLDEFTFEAATVLGYQAALAPSDRSQFDSGQSNRLGDINPANGSEALHDTLCADGTSDQNPGGRSNQYTFEEVLAAASASDIGLT